jgi:hypothetical protein
MTRAQALLYISCPYRSNSDKVKLSHFVDTPVITRLFSNKASKLSFSDVQTLAQILSVTCPTELEIESTIANNKILSRLDDQIPDQDPDVKRTAQDGHANGEAHYQKARHSDGSTVDIPQFQSARGWSNAGTTEDRLRKKTTTTERIGFQSASNHFAELQKHGNVTCEAEKVMRDRRVSHESMMLTTAKASVAVAGNGTTATVTKTKYTTIARTNKRPAGQQSLMGFFAKKQSEDGMESLSVAVASEKPRTATDVIRGFGAAEMTLRDQLDCLPAPSIPNRPPTDFILLSSSPPQRTPKRPKVKAQETAMHHPHRNAEEHPMTVNLGATAEAATYGQPPVLQSSSPPRSPVFNDFCAAMVEGDLPRTGPDERVEDDVLPNFNDVPREKIISPATMGPGGVRGRGSASRRTLGIRRSMNGWQNRGGRQRG